MKRIKLLHFIQSSAPSSYLNAIAAHTDRSRFDVTVASLGPPGILQSEMAERDVPSFSLDCVRRAQYPKAVFRLARWLRKERIDILQTHLFEASLVGLAAGRLARTPLLVLNDHHSAEVLLQRKPTIVGLDRLMTRFLAHRVLAPSSYMKEILTREENVLPERIAVIPYGLDLDLLKPSPGARERIRKELRIEGHVVFGAVGRLHWVKNYPDLLKAFARVAREQPNLSLVIAGDGPERDRLAERVRELSMENRVFFVGHRRDVVDILSAIDVLVHASFVECSVQVVAEAFAVRTPVVSTAVGGATDLVESGVSGFLVPPGSSDALEKALRTMIERRPEWKAMGEAGRKRVERNAAQRIFPRYEAQYVRWLAELRRRERDSGTLERQPLDPSTPWWAQHVSRYFFARPYTESRRVLDIACGTGYGLGILRDSAAGVIGVDVDIEAARVARGEAEVLVADGTRLPFADRSFDVVVSFETIEHLRDRAQFVSELSRVLALDGLLVLSTPNANHTEPVNGKPKNPFHLHEYTPDELQAELLGSFSTLELFGQRLDSRFAVSPFWEEQERLRQRGQRASALLWRAFYKLPRRLGDRMSRLLWRHALIPEAADYRFDGSNVASAPVLVAVCRDPGASPSAAMKSKTVSVVVTNYNYGRFLGQAIASVLAQTSPPFEVIVVDDGSTDESHEVVRSFGSRIRAIRQENRGVSAARNRGIGESRGELVAFLDADDWWLPEKLARQVEEFRRESVGMVYTGLRYVDARGEVLSTTTIGRRGCVLEDLALLRAPGVPASGSSPLVRRSVLEKVGGFDEALSTSADWDMWRRIACHYEIEIVPEPLTVYRQHGGSMHLRVELFERDMLRAFQSMFDDPAASAVHPLRKRCYGKLFLMLAGSFFRAGEYLKGTAYLARGIAAWPPSIGRVLARPFRRFDRGVVS